MACEIYNQNELSLKYEAVKTMKGKYLSDNE